jgi:hypothetical protein
MSVIQECEDLEDFPPSLWVFEQRSEYMRPELQFAVMRTNADAAVSEPSAFEDE